MSAKKILIIGVVLIVGWAVRELSLIDNSAIEDRSSETAETLAQSSDVDSGANAATSRSKDSVTTSQAAPAPQAPMAMNAASAGALKQDGAESKDTPIESLRIEEEIVKLLEDQGETLRDFASTTRVENGWKVEVHVDHPALSQAGIRSGDTITFESLNSQLRIPERSFLATRMMHILEILER